MLLALSVFVLTVFAGIAEPALAGVSSERGAPEGLGRWILHLHRLPPASRGRSDVPRSATSELSALGTERQSVSRSIATISIVLVA